MMILKEIAGAGEKQMICRGVLEALPEWFGIPESVEEYVRESEKLPMAVVFDGDRPVGFVTVSDPSPDACEIHSMGVLREWQGKGGGRLLVEWAAGLTRRKGRPLLVVKTLSPRADYKPYLGTHRFYRLCGFREVGVYPQIWGETDPCLIMVLSVAEK